MRIPISLILTLLIADCFRTLPAFAQSTQDWAHCLREDYLKTPDVPIEGCTTIIETGDRILRNLATAYNNRGVAYRLKANYAHAIEDFNEAIRLTPKNASLFNNRGVTYRAMGELDRAIANYDQAISIKPDYVAAFYNRGLALAEKREYVKAISDFNVVLHVDSKNPTVLYRRGTAYLNNGDIEVGNADLAAAKALNPNIAEDIRRGGP